LGWFVLALLSLGLGKLGVVCYGLLFLGFKEIEGWIVKEKGEQGKIIKTIKIGLLFLGFRCN
jgi:hypothetical protein